MSESKQFLNIIRIFDPDQQTELIEIMKQYNFDEIIERRGTNCVKYDLLKKDFGNENLVPLWVADMDFRTPDFIVNAIKKRLEHEIFGYTFDSDSYYNSIIEWVHYKHNWKIQREWLSYIPGIVKGIGFVLQCFTKPGDKVIIQPPVYHPFRIVPENMHREVVYNPLKTVDDIYEMDFENLESVIDEHCKVLILCNPHNPGGVVWKKDTLVKLAEVCAKHNILVISDEIHAEMAYPQYTHHPFATVSETAANCSITFITKPGDKVIIQPPVYHPFRIVPENMHREVVYNPLKTVDDIYEMDFENLESVIDEHCKVLILCNPHNPGGVVWKKDTLVKLAEVCAKHNILVISDEIHAEMAYPQYTHHPFATVSETAANCSITFMAPSKTFNIAGIVTSYSIIPNAEIREKFYSFMEAGEFNAGTIFAYTATEAAYTYGAEWLQQMRMYITENVRFVDEYCKSKLPKIKVYPPQASFLVWLDCRDLKLSQPELVSLFQDKAGLLLNDGSMFGPGGEGHMRLNIGCPRSVLSSALDALKKAIDKK